MKGMIVSGEFGKILAREKKGEKLELGELLIAENKNVKVLLQVFNLMYGSQISPQNMELISGMKLEENEDIELMDMHLRNYILANLKSLIKISDKAEICKNLPDIFSTVRAVDKEDLKFLTKPNKPLFIGYLRSGTKIIDVPIYLRGEACFSHHILISATTGRGKSNLTSCMLWDSMNHDYAGLLVLDPHDEYYGRNSLGLKDHPNSRKLSYYTIKSVPVGQRKLKINLKYVRPGHFQGVYDWSSTQKEALGAYYKKYREKWVESILMDEPIEGFKPETIGVLKRRFMQILDINVVEEKLICNGVFDSNLGESTIGDVVKDLEEGKKVIIDTSSFDGKLEILIGSLFATEIYRKYERYKMRGELESKPVVSIVLEEAPRVLGKEVLERGRNIFSTIAKEGRKFRIGLTAITQLPSLIPRDILANMNTKIILGIEMKPERQAIIESASQDLSDDDRNIASLDKGEAIISSNFTKFAIPVKIPLFKEFAEEKPKREFQF